ncbi:MAG: hypothetical protein ACOYOE_11985 [Chlorobium sp.]
MKQHDAPLESMKLQHNAQLESMKLQHEIELQVVIEGGRSFESSEQNRPAPK